MAFGIAPPMPRPVTARQAINDSTDRAVAVSSDPTPKISAHAISTGLRPMRSASGPLTSAPIIMPISPLEITDPEYAARDLQLGDQGGGDEAHGLRVETVHEHDQPAHRRHQQLVAADGTVVDELADVESGGCSHDARIAGQLISSR